MTDLETSHSRRSPGPRWLVESAPRSGQGTWPKELTVVCIHGAMDRGAGMTKLTRQLSDAPTIRYDRRGYGHARLLGPGRLADHVDDLAKIVGDRPVVLFGHSFGGLVALAATARHTIDVRALALYEAPTPWMSWWPAWPGPKGDADNVSSAVAGDTAEAFLRSMIGDQRWERLPAKTREDRRAEGPALLADTSPETSDAMPFELDGTTIPVVVAYGGASLVQYKHAAEELASGLAHAELHRIDGAYHGAPFSRSEDVALLIRRAAILASVE